MKFPTLTLCAGLALLAPLVGCRQAPPPVKEPPFPPRIVIESSRGKPNEPPRPVPPGGAVKLISGANATEVGIDFYPGSTISKSESITKNGETTAAAELTTKDDYAKVVAFYRARYASPELKVVEQTVNRGKLTLLNWRDPEGNFTVGIRRDDVKHQTIVALAKVKAKRHYPTR